MEKNKTMMIVIIVLLVVLLATIVGVSIFAYQVISGKKTESTKTEQTAVPQLKPEEIEPVPLTSPLSTNLAASADGETHVIRVSLAIGVDNTDKKKSPEFITLVSSKEAIVRDIALGVIKSKTYEELTRPDGRNILRDEILKQLQNSFQNNLLVDLYISDWYLQ